MGIYSWMLKLAQIFNWFLSRQIKKFFFFAKNSWNGNQKIGNFLIYVYMFFDTLFVCCRRVDVMALALAVVVLLLVKIMVIVAAKGYFQQYFWHTHTIVAKQLITLSLSPWMVSPRKTEEKEENKIPLTELRIKIKQKEKNKKTEEPFWSLKCEYNQTTVSFFANVIIILKVIIAIIKLKFKNFCHYLHLFNPVPHQRFIYRKTNTNHTIRLSFSGAAKINK